MATTLFTPEDARSAGWLARCLRAAAQAVPEWLLAEAGEEAAAAVSASGAPPGAQGEGRGRGMRRAAKLGAFLVGPLPVLGGSGAAAVQQPERQHQQQQQEPPANSSPM